MNKQLTGLLTLLALSATTGVNAAVFDFGAIGNGDITVSGITGERGAASFDFTVGGISVNTSALGGKNAYLDSKFNNLFGGLGVCGTLDSTNQCNPTSDDNVTFDETLVLQFDQLVNIGTTTFNNGNHETLFSGDFELSIDGGTAVTYALTNLFTMDLIGTRFEFFNPNAGGGPTVSNNLQFYITSIDVTAVPVPAAVWLFGSGLLGLAGIARRKV